VRRSMAVLGVALMLDQHCAVADMLVRCLMHRAQEWGWSKKGNDEGHHCSEAEQLRQSPLRLLAV